MGLHISNRATPKQEILLTDLGYNKSTTNWPLTQDQAAQIITELLELQKHERVAEQDNVGNLDEWGKSEEELDDPFGTTNKWKKEK